MGDTDTQAAVRDGLAAVRGRDVRLLVVDMDGTLLDGDGEIPEGLWPALDRLAAAGIVFAPASGRQYATLLSMFERARAGMVFIAENGSYVVRDDVEVSSTTLPPDLVRDVVTRMRGLTRDGEDLGVVVCGKDAAYVERHDRAFVDQVDPYYASLVEVDDLLALGPDVVEAVIKVAVLAFDGPEQRVEPALAPLRPGHQVVVSGNHWVDVMHAEVHKGVAVRRLQASLGVGRDQTVVLGDYLNDLEMLDEATLSFAMDNAHPDVVARARHRAPANTEQGVLQVIDAILDRG